MITNLLSILAAFTVPQELGTNPRSFFWFLPLAAAIAVVYKAAKLPEIKARSFLRESLTLFASIVFFMILIAVCLIAFSYLATE